MFGMYRTFLALMVVALHLGGVPMIGVYAVFGFYILSGYLMTLIMQANYGYTVVGFCRYAANRFLRIYPIYWVSILVSALLIWRLGNDFTSAYHPSMHFPEDVYTLIKNFSLFSLEGRGLSARLTPPAWALTVEVFFYVLIGLGISKNRKITLIWFFFSAAYHLISVSLGLGWADRYYSVFAASLPFSTGAILFHYKAEIAKKYKDKLKTRAYQNLPYILFFAILSNWFLGLTLSRAGGFFFYSNYMLCAAMVLVLAGRKQLPGITQAVDRWWGEFSYPIYLLHYQTGLVMIVLLSAIGFDLSRPSLALMFVSVPAILACSWIVIITLTKPIEYIRVKVKSKT